MYYNKFGEKGKGESVQDLTGIFLEYHKKMKQIFRRKGFFDRMWIKLTNFFPAPRGFLPRTVQVAKTGRKIGK